MIKRWKQFIESITNPDSYLDMRMQEIKDLLSSTENGESLIYEWENKNDHELFVNFSANGMNVRYEFDIDDMQITKIANNVHDYTEDVESLEAGVEMIKKDIHSILGISEKNIYESKYEESIFLIIEAGEGNSFIKNRYSNLEINRKLMKLLDKKFDLNLGEISDKHKIDGSKVADISKFLISLGLKKDEISSNGRVRLTFKGHLTLKDFKKIKIFESFYSPKFGNIDLALEVENKYRLDRNNFDEDEFLEELGVPEDEMFLMTFWTSLELGRDKYRNMSDDEFFDLYKKETTL